MTLAETGIGIYRRHGATPDHLQVFGERSSGTNFVNRLLAKLNFDQEETSWRRAPQISLVLEHIYGILVADKRHSVFYLHFYSKTD